MLYDDDLNEKKKEISNFLSKMSANCELMESFSKLCKEIDENCSISCFKKMKKLEDFEKAIIEIAQKERTKKKDVIDKKKSIKGKLNEIGNADLWGKYSKIEDEFEENEDLSLTDKMKMLEDLENIIQSPQRIHPQIQEVHKKMNLIINSSPAAQQIYNQRIEQTHSLTDQSAKLSILEGILKEIQIYDFTNIECSYDDAEEFKEGNFLIIGGTGSGKSSFINLLDAIQQCKPIKKLQKVKIKPSNHLDGDIQSEANVKDPSKSQTQKSFNYHFEFAINKVGYKINIIDTPGLGNWKDIKKDEENIEDVLKYIKNNSDSFGNCLHGIFLLQNGTDPRLPIETQYILSRCKRLVPDTFEKHLYCILTDSLIQPNFSIDGICQKCNYNIPLDHRFHMNNNLFQLNWKENPELLIEAEKCFIRSMATMIKVLGKCCSQPSVSANSYSTICDSRINFRSTLAQSAKKLQMLNKRAEYISVLIHEVSIGKNNIEDLKRKTDQLTTETITAYELEPSANKNTICMACNKICCENCKCQLGWISSRIYFPCNNFSWRKCKSCKCPTSVHHNTSQKFIEIKKTQNKKNIDKNQLKKVNDEKQLTSKIIDEKEALISDLKKNQCMCNEEITDLKEEIKKYVKKIKNEVKLFNYYDELEIGTKILLQKKSILAANLSSDPKNQTYINDNLANEKAIKEYEELIKLAQPIIFDQQSSA